MDKRAATGRTGSGLRAERAPAQRAPADTRRSLDAAPEGSPAATRRAAPPTSEPARLAAEVARLEAELGTLRARVQELEASAERDPLTEVLNRRGFARELARAIAYLTRYPARAVLVYLDLDGFKPVNDTHGHAAGDAVLKAVAATLTGHVRASDSVGRLGGDEFAVLLWNLSEAAAHAKALALETDIASAAIAWQGRTLSVGASAGIALLAATDSAEEVMGRADAAMYARKGARRR
jgi:diguanylate cyclase (GGDEF)-like protein